MQIYNTHYKNKQAIRLSSGEMSCMIMPDGGKMVSLTDKSGCEMLAQAPAGCGEDGRKNAIYKDLTLYGSYIESECSAFDDMFPTIDPWQSPYREYLDHGEVCRIVHECRIIYENGEAKLRTGARSPFGDYIFVKTYSGYKCGFKIEYEAQNISDRPLKAIWASHMMIEAREGSSIGLSEGEYTAEFMFCDGGTQTRGSKELIKSKCTLLTSAPYDTNGSAYKFYITEPYKGHFTYRNIKIECRGADYIGIWINNGCFKGMYNVAAEFCTGAFDTPGEAERRGADVTLMPGQSRKWEMYITEGTEE